MFSAAFASPTSLLAAALAVWTAGALAGPMPRYLHVIVVMEENHGPTEIIGNPDAPHLSALARAYGLAANYFGVVHPSEGNYVALAGGDTFGIRDDDPYTCAPHSPDPLCKHANRPGYVDHTVHVSSLAAELESHGLTWRVYAESLPAPGALDVTFPPKGNPDHRPAALYASKHDGFMNFSSIQNNPARADHMVGFDRLRADLAQGTVPNYAFVVPNQCNDMHGLDGADVPSDCKKSNNDARITRGDAVAGHLVDAITASPIWHAPGNTAIAIVFDEGGHHAPPGNPQGCCGDSPARPFNSGGGHAIAIVITNHGPRGLVDSTPYNHYALLRTVEDALGTGTHLRHAGDADVSPMEPLFAVPR